MAQLTALLRAEQSERAIIMVGPPGIGKTTLWESAVSVASVAGLTVLASRAAEAESTLPFTVLSDLLADVDLDTVPSLPGPQRRALDVALLRAERTGPDPQPRAVGLALVNVLRVLADRGSVLIALDDLQWMDRASSEVLAYALRRLGNDGVYLLAARLTGYLSPLDHVLGPTQPLEVAGLSLGSIRHLLSSRLGLVLGRRVVREVFEITRGNPMYALEIGRVLASTGAPQVGESLQLPPSLDEMLLARVNASPEARRALLAVGLGGPLTEPELLAVVSQAEVEGALESGLLVDREGRHVAEHPLVASTVVRHASAAGRRAMHESLAATFVEPIRHARHVAAATQRPDSRVAELVAGAAGEAGRRGAMREAIHLAREALRLTPRGDPARDDRVLVLADHLFQAAENRELHELLTAEFASLGPGRARARGHLLGVHLASSQEDWDEHLLGVLEEVADGYERVVALVHQSLDATTSWVERLDVAEQKAEEALRLAHQGPGRRGACYALGWTRILRGQPIDDLAGLAEDPADTSVGFEFGYQELLGVHLAFRGYVNEARTMLATAAARAAERGDEESWASIHHKRCELELRAGSPHAAGPLIDEAETDYGSLRVGTRSHVARHRALSACLRGHIAAAQDWAARSQALIVGQRWDALELDRILGIVAQLDAKPSVAEDHLLRVWRHVRHERLMEPGAFPVAAELVEAALATGNRPQAIEVLAHLEEVVAHRDHPWARATVARCRALVALNDGAAVEEARADLVDAAQRYDLLGCHFDSARTLLALGRQARRARKWAIAREALERAGDAFEVLGCEGWATEARTILAGVGGRRPGPVGSLTPTEQRVVDLASAGRSNREIAAALFVSVHTVEVHLTRAYLKLGVTSRSQLVKALARLEQPAVKDVPLIN